MAVTEPQSAREYDDRTTAPVKSVLIEIGQILFNARVEDKAVWSRGLLVSYSGFTDGGLTAFGRGKRVICMDGRDLHDVLSRRLDLAAVLAEKARRAAETGNPFVRVTDLRAFSSP